MTHGVCVCDNALIVSIDKINGRVTVYEESLACSTVLINSTASVHDQTNDGLTDAINGGAIVSLSELLVSAIKLHSDVTVYVIPIDCFDWEYQQQGSCIRYNNCLFQLYMMQ